MNIVANKLIQNCSQIYTEFLKIFKQVNSNFSESDLKKFEINSQELLENCSDEKLQSKIGIKALLVGKIQSGKTNNYLHILARFFSKNYQMGIVFSGLDNEIFEQTLQRIRIFKKLNFVDTDIPNFQIISSKEKMDSDVLETINEKLKKNEEKIIIVSLKEDDNLKRICEMFEKNKTLRERKILIIDDEGDQASLDSKKMTNNENVTEINSLINKLLSYLKDFVFFSVTATPYANLLLEKSDKLSPDFTYLLSPGKGYFGLNDIVQEQKQFVVEIPENDGEKLMDLNMTIPKSLKRAIGTFLIAGYLAKIRSKSKNTTYQMLVHVDRQIDSHNKIYEKIIEWKKQIKNFSKHKDWNNNEFIEILQEGIAEIGKTIPDHSIDLKNYETLQKIKSLFSQTKIKVLNSEGEKLTTNYHTEMEILIGGKLLERGITLKNLLVTFITIRPKNKTQMDTTLQRARWFGYRNNVRTLLRVFMVRSLIQDFYNIFVFEQQLWYSLSQIQKNKIPHKNWNPYIMEYSPRLSSTNSQRVKTTGEAELKIAHKQRYCWKVTEREEKWIQKIKQKAIFKKNKESEWQEILYDDFDKLMQFNETMIFLSSVLKEKLNIKETILNNRLFPHLRAGIKFKFIFKKSLPMECFHNNSVNEHCEVSGHELGNQYNDLYLNNKLENKKTFLLLVYEIHLKCSRTRKDKKVFIYTLISPLVLWKN